MEYELHPWCRLVTREKKAAETTNRRHTNPPKAKKKTTKVKQYVQYYIDCFVYLILVGEFINRKHNVKESSWCGGE